jgi:hypothetical protein
MFTPPVAKPEEKSAAQIGTSPLAVHWASPWRWQRRRRLALRPVPRDWASSLPERAGQPELEMGQGRGGGVRRPSPATAPRLPGPIQPKLKVGAVNDPQEREADRVADQVMRMPSPGETMRVKIHQLHGT